MTFQQWAEMQMEESTTMDDGAVITRRDVITAIAHENGLRVEGVPAMDENGWTVVFLFPDVMDYDGEPFYLDIRATVLEWIRKCKRRMSPQTLNPSDN